MAGIPSFQDVLDAVSQGETVTQRGLEGALKAHASISNDLARWKLARWILWVYSIVVTATTGYLLYRGYVSGENVGPELFDLIKVAVIPIMTFVLGFYYGTSSKS
jgi:hypothetical protein